jgi:hypothetical protein
MKRTLTEGCTLLAVGGAVALASLGFADVQTLPKGTVICISLKHARDYVLYSAEAPDFAKDLIDRAACSRLDKPTEAIVDGKSEQGFKPYRLRSGHLVWVKQP